MALITQDKKFIDQTFDKNIKKALGDFRVDFRNEIKGNISSESNSLKNEVREDMNKLRSDVKGDMNQFRLDIRNDMVLFKKEINEDFKHHTGVLMNGFRDEMKIFKELLSEKPSRDDVREIVHSELDRVVKLSGLIY